MKIALVRPPDPEPPPNDFGPPWDLAMAAACLDAAGLAVRGHDWQRAPLETLEARVDRLLDEAAPDVVGIFTEYAQRHHAFAIARRVRERAPEVRVVLAGELPAAAPEVSLRESGADAVVLDEGEEAWPELVGAWAEGRDPASVSGLILATAEGPRRTAPRPLREDLDALPDPAYHLIDEAGTPDAGPEGAAPEIASVHCSSLRRALVVRGSRGCFYRCRFCVESTRSSKVRGLSPERLVDQIAALTADAPGTDVVFGDSLFTFDRERALAVSRALAERALGVRWSVMTRTDHVDVELLRAMAEAGCVEVAFGVESGSWTVQRAIDKRLAPDTIGPAFAAAREAGVRAVLMLMVGNPGETPATVRETIARVRGLEPDRVLIKTAKLEPGSRLWADEEAAGRVGEATLAGPVPYPPHLESAFSAADIAGFKERLHPRTSWIDLGALPDPLAARAAIAWAAPR
ncbi:MAG: B12-binding domain-containing radical SAM protein, partial [Deltaproteobacteria bacterium]